MTNDQLISFKNNRALVKAFDISRQSFIKNYIRKQRINVRTASDLSITDLINYCNTLSASWKIYSQQFLLSCFRLL